MIHGKDHPETFLFDIALRMLGRFRRLQLAPSLRRESEPVDDRVEVARRTGARVEVGACGSAVCLSSTRWIGQVDEQVARGLILLGACCKAATSCVRRSVASLACSGTYAMREARVRE